MPDNSFTIGAAVNVQQLAAGMNQAGNITREALDKMLVDFSNASSASSRAVAKISDDTRAAATSVDSSWKRVTEASLAYTSALKEVSGATYLARAAGEGDAASTSLLAAAKQKAAGAAMELAEANEAVGIATRGASEANIEARLTTDVLTGNIARADQALIRFASHSEMIGPLISAAFVPFAIATFAEILFRAGEKVYEVFENVVLLRGAIEALEKVEASSGEKAASLNYEYEEGLARRLKAQGKLNEATAEFAKAASDKPLELIKIDDKDVLKQLSPDFVSFLSAVHKTSDAPTVIARIGAEAASTAKDLEKAKQMLEEIAQTPDTQATGDPTVDTATYGGGNGLALERQSKQVSDLTHKLSILHNAMGQVQSETGIASNTALTQQAEDEKKRKPENETARTAEALEKAHQEIKDALSKTFETRVEIAKKEDEMFAQSELKESGKAFEALDKKLEAQTKYAEESAKITEQSSLRQIAGEESVAQGVARIQEARLAGTFTTESRRIQISAQINADLLAQQEKLENDKLAVIVKGIEAQKSILLGGGTEKQFTISNADNPAQLAKLMQLNAQLEAAAQTHAQKMQQFQTQQTLQSQDAANRQTQAFMQSFSQINSGVMTSINGWLTGTQTFTRSMQSLWHSLVMDIINEIEKIALKWVEQHLIMAAYNAIFHTQSVAQDTAATVTQTAVHSAANVAMATSDAGLAAAGTFAFYSAIFPPTAPAFAAAAFAEGMGFAGLASAEGGMVSGSEQLAFIHKNEMVLPAPLSKGFQHIIGNMSGGSKQEPSNAGGGSSEVNHNYGGVNISAFDSKGVSDMIRRNSREFTRAAAGIVRNGWRPK